VAENEMLPPRRRLAVSALGDLAIGAAHADEEAAHQHAAVIVARVGHVRDAGRAALTRHHRHRAHAGQGRTATSEPHHPTRMKMAAATAAIIEPRQ
jgi:hypothetical protein